MCGVDRWLLFAHPGQDLGLDVLVDLFAVTRALVDWEFDGIGFDTLQIREVIERLADRGEDLTEAADLVAFTSADRVELALHRARILPGVANLAVVAAGLARVVLVAVGAPQQGVGLDLDVQGGLLLDLRHRALERTLRRLPVFAVDVMSANRERDLRRLRRIALLVLLVEQLGVGHGLVLLTKAET